MHYVYSYISAEVRRCFVRYDMSAAALVQLIITMQRAPGSENSTGAKWMSWTCKSIDSVDRLMQT